jgi:hypothetical protein
MANLVGEGIRWSHAQRRHARSPKADRTDLEELPTVHIHRGSPDSGTRATGQAAALSQ